MGIFGFVLFFKEAEPDQPSREILNTSQSRFTASSPGQRLELVQLDAEKLGLIKKSLALGSILAKPQENEGLIKTSGEALDFLNANISMAEIPEKYAEDDEAYYFSGGTSASRVLDFSSGIAVSKRSGVVTIW